MSIGKSIALTLVLVIGCVAQSGCSSSNCDGLYCNNQCVQVDSDPNNCGSCGQKCGPSQVCDQSKCTDSCSGGLKQCDRACVDVTSSTAHCGGCNKPCATGQQCTAGKCQGGTGKDGGIEPDTSTPQCTDRVAITANGALDLDLKVVTVSGKVTKNGQAIPAATQYNHRGRLEFVDKYGVTLPVKRFGPSGDATYQIDLIADTYDVYYNSLAGSNCEDTLPLPCHYPRVLIKKNVQATASGGLDIDIKVSRVTGNVSKNGQAVSSATQYSHRGRLEFVDERGSTLAAKRFAASGATSYDVELVAGTYDVYYNSLAGSNCEDTLPLPCHYPRALLKSAVNATSSGGLDIDVKVSRVTGSVSKNGQAVPSATQYSHRGRLEFVDVRGSTLAAKRFAASGATSYDVELIAGNYDVYYNALAGSNCEDTLPLPCHHPRALLKSAVNATSSGGLDIDVKVSRVTGSVSKNGQAVPGATQYSHRGRLEFVDGRGSTLAAKRFAASGATSYDVELIAGNYDVYYNALAGSNCEDTLPLPCHHPRALLKSAVNATSSGGLDIDVKVSRVTGSVSKNGQAVPGATQYSHRGRLEFVDGRSSTLAAKRFAANGATNYDVELIAGNYDVYYNALAGSNCEDTLPLPCHHPRALLKSAVNATSSGGLDIDVKTATVSGNVSKNGQALPSATQYSHRGRLEFVDERGSTLAAKRFTANGATTYATEVIAGPYDIYYNALAGSNCEDKLPLPCHTPRKLLRGCGAPVATTP